MNETVTVKRANVRLQVAANDVERYIAKGYDVIDKDGSIITKSIPTDIATLKKEYSEHLATIKALEDELQFYKLRVQELEEGNAETTADVEEKPKRKRKTVDSE